MKKVFEDFFRESGGKPFLFKEKEICLSFKIDLEQATNFKITNFETNSKWKQGIVLSSPKGNISLRNIVHRKFVLWEDNFSEIEEFTVDNTFIIYNVWDTGNGTMQYGHNGAGMHVVKKNKMFLFYCNDGFPDESLTDLKFSLEEV